MDLAVVPSFIEVTIEGSERTAVRMAVFKRPVVQQNPTVATNGNGRH